MKTIFVIHGFNIHRTAADIHMSPLVTGLKLKDYRVVPVDISWRRKIPTQFAKEFSEIYKTKSTDYNIVLGNSFGSVVALITAAELKPDELYLCSISPFFKEDRGKLPDSYAIQRFGHRRAYDLWSLSFEDIAKKINSKTTITYGEKEIVLYPALIDRCKIAAKLISDAKLYMLPKSPHSMSDKTYTNELLKLF